MNPNDPKKRSFVDVGPECHFPIQNLPFGVFSTTADSTHRVGVAIGSFVLDLAALEANGLLRVGKRTADGGPVFRRDALNEFMCLGPAAWKAARRRVSELLDERHPELRDDRQLRERVLLPISDVQMHLPIKVSGFTDFYSSKEHAINAGSIFRGNNALLPNWSHIPLGYNGRASTVVVSGTPIRRPLGQTKTSDSGQPSFGPSARLDFEAEMGVVIGQGSIMGQILTETTAEDMIFGWTLLNDWSARDIQHWEYVPLGPFQAKAFATSIGPWIVTKEAMEPFRKAGPRQDPEPLSYLRQRGANNYDVQLSVSLRPGGAARAELISAPNFKYMYWSSVQQLVHHASSGCAMNVGDLLGSGTISGPSKNERGCLLELTWGGREPLELPGGAKRAYLQDGDSLMISGWCQGDGYRVGFGEVEGRILSRLPPPSD